MDSKNYSENSGGQSELHMEIKKGGFKKTEKHTMNKYKTIT